MSTESKKSSPLGFVKGLLFDETPEQQPRPSAPPPPVPAARASAFPSMAPPVAGYVPSPAPSTVAPDPSVMARLEAKIREAMTGPYQGFLAQYEKLHTVLPDETMCFRAALVASGCTRNDLLQALDKGLATLTGARQEFQRSVEAKKNGIQTTLTQASAQTEEAIKAKTAQITALQAEVGALVESVRANQEKAQEDQRHLDTVCAGFDAAYEQFVQRLTSQRAQMPEGG